MDKIKKLQGHEKLLLHACCGPCSLEPIKILTGHNINFSIFYSNSNIAPESEYNLRLKTIKNYCEENNINFIEDSYDNQNWMWEVKDSQFEKPERCKLCYRSRFKNAAKYAHHHGFTHLGTTLTISPYQYINLIQEQLELICKQYDLKSYFQDYSPYYYKAQKRAKELDFYRQKYCGCLYSKKEAEKEKEENSKLKQLRHEEHELLLQKKREERDLYNEKRSRQKKILKELRNNAHE